MSPEVFTQLVARIEGFGVDSRVEDGGVSRVLLLRPGRATCKRRCDQQDQRRPSQAFRHLEQPHSVELVGAFPHVIAYEGAKRIHRKKRWNPQAVPSVAARGVFMRVGLHTARSVSAQFGSYLAGLGVRALEVVGKLALYMLAARALGAAEAGLFFICITWSGLASAAARMGFERAMTRHIAAELAIGEPGLARAALLLGVLVTLLGGAVAAIATLALASPAALYVFRQPELATPLVLSAAAVVPQTLMVVAGSVLAGLNRGVASQVVQNALWPLLTLAALGLGARSVEALLLAMAAAMMISTVTGIALVAIRRDVFSGRESRSTETKTLPALWRTALPLGVVELIQISLAAVPVLVLGVFADPASVGAFSVANRISMMIWVVIISIGTVAAARFAEHHRRGELAELKRVNRAVRLAVSVSGVPLIVAMMLFPGPLLHLIGPGFEIAATALVIMAVGQLVNCLLPCQDVVLAMTGHGYWLQRLNLLQFATCLVLASVLIPAYGMLGAALVTATTIIQGAVGTTLVVRRVLPGAF
jgi:O-antigen/teichoic acid export membrane protein